MVLMWSIFLFFLTSSHLSVKKLQLVLTPFSSFFPLSLDEGMSEKTTLLSHSFQQLDRIDSLSEQISFLEERLGTCEWPQTDPFYCSQVKSQYFVELHGNLVSWESRICNKKSQIKDKRPHKISNVIKFTIQSINIIQSCASNVITFDYDVIQ